MKFPAKPAQVTIAEKFTIECDKADAARIAAHQWRLWEIAGTRRVTFVAQVANERGPIMQQLAAFVLEQSPATYCVQVDVSRVFDYTRKNLAVYQAPAPRAATVKNTELPPVPKTAKGAK